jgi:hypothetical protein
MMVLNTLSIVKVCNVNYMGKNEKTRIWKEASVAYCGICQEELRWQQQSVWTGGFPADTWITQITAYEPAQYEKIF